MLLVQKPQHPISPSFMSPMKLSPAQFHRRNPSAPAAVVQVHPTRTPGLLSLSKPPLRPISNSPSNPRLSTPRPPKSTKTTQTLDGQPEKPRGRVSPAKDKTARNSSKPRNASGRGRQPSPPPIPDQQISDSDTPAAPSNTNTATPVSTILTAPSGRLAKRRNRNSTITPHSASTPPPKAKRSPSPVKARVAPFPVPISTPKKPRTSTIMPLSRSVPIPSHHNTRVPLRRVTTDKEGDSFPICDDNDSDAEPVTPVRGQGVTWQQSGLFDSDVDDSQVPHTAPLSSRTQTARHYFPSPIPSPTPSPRRPAHGRTPSFPSDALFNMSFDSSSDNELNMHSQTDDMRALFGLPNHRRPRMNTVRPASVSGSPAQGRGGSAYASSTFQNSPSPEALPPPSFSFAVEKLSFKQQA